MHNPIQNKERLERILAKHGPELRRTARVLAGSDERGEELFQMLMLWALSTESPVYYSSLRAYIRKMVNFTCFTGEDVSFEPPDELETPEQDPDRAFWRANALTALREIHEAMDPYEKVLIREILIRGRTADAIAEERRVPSRTLRFHYDRAIEKLARRADHDDLRKALALPIFALVPVSPGKAWTFSKRIAVVTTAAMVFCAAVVSLALLIGGPDLDSLAASGENAHEVAQPLTGFENSQVMDSLDSADGDLQTPEGETADPAKSLAPTSIQSSAAGKAPRPNRVEPETWRDQVTHPDQEWVQEFRSDGSLQREYQIVPWMPIDRQKWGVLRELDRSGRDQRLQHFRAGKPHGPLFRFVGGEAKLIAFYLDGERQKRK